MWKNIGNVVGSAIQKVKTLQSELENQLDEAVGNKNETKVVNSNSDLNDCQVNTPNHDRNYVQNLELDDGALRNQHNIDPHVPLASSTNISSYLKPGDSDHNASSNNDIQGRSNSITKQDELVVTTENSLLTNKKDEPSTSEPTVYLPSEEPLAVSKPKRKKKLVSNVSKISDDVAAVETVNISTHSSGTVVSTASDADTKYDDSNSNSSLRNTDNSTCEIMTGITKPISSSFFDDDYTVDTVISSKKMVVAPLTNESDSKRHFIHNDVAENIDNAVNGHIYGSSSSSSIVPVDTMDESLSSKKVENVVDAEASISSDIHEKQIPVQVVNNDIRASSSTAAEENELIDQQLQSQQVPSSSTITTQTAIISADDDDRKNNNNNNTDNEAITSITPTTVTTNNDKHDHDTYDTTKAAAVIIIDETPNVTNNSDNIHNNTINNEALTTICETPTTATICNNNNNNDDDNNNNNDNHNVNSSTPITTTTNNNNNSNNNTDSIGVAAEATIQKLQEVIADRERALETAMTKMYEINQLLIESESVVMSLKSDITVKNNRIDSLQVENTNYINTIQNNTETTSAASVVVINELKNKIKKLNEVIQEKDEKLGLFEHEGQLLSKKQGEYEKTIKQLKKDMKEKMSENMKLKESKDQLVKAIEEMQEVIRKKETDYNTMNKSISAMSAVNQNSNGKFQKLENEILIKGEEIVSQKKALETAWFENNELKRTLVEIKTERDDYKRLLNEGASKVVETESSRRDVEQREAILKATSKQLQDSLQRQMNEYTIREDRLRDELNEMRKRWQEAILSRENLTTELSSSTTPLLRQISQLQESLQQKTTTWQNIESCLSERAYLAEKKKLEYEIQLDQYKDQIKNTMTKMNEYKDKCSEYDHQLASLKSVNQDLTHQLQENQSQLYIEMAQKQQYQSQIQEIEMAKQMEIQELKIYYDDCIKKINITLEGLENEKNELLQQIQQQQQQQYLIQENGSSCNRNAPTVAKQRQEHNNDDDGDNANILLPSKNNSNNSRTITNNTTATNYDDDDDDDESKAGNASKTGFIKSSYANSERVLQQKHKKDQDHRNLYLKIQQIEASRDAMLEEVSYLSSKNAEYEDKLSHWGELNQQIQTIQKQKDMLLVLLGEKDEELQASVADNMEVKSLYQHHIKELVLQLTPPSSSSSLPSSSSSLSS